MGCEASSYLSDCERFHPCAALERNRITLSGGWTEQLYPPNFDYRQTAPTVGLSYGYRAVKVHGDRRPASALACSPGQDVCNRFGCYDPNDRYIWIPIGVRFIAPLVAGRVELSVGGGGLIQRYSVSNPDNPYSNASDNSLGGYFTDGRRRGAGSPAPFLARRDAALPPGKPGVSPRPVVSQSPGTSVSDFERSEAPVGNRRAACQAAPRRISQ